MGKQALVVDDSPTAVALLKRSLEQLNIAAHSVGTGEDALDFLAKADPLPDYVFMDVMMPGIDGFEATKQVLSQSRTAHLPIIIYTTLKSEIDQKKAKDVGATGYLTKPFNQSGLKACLDQL